METLILSKQKIKIYRLISICRYQKLFLFNYTFFSITFSQTFEIENYLFFNEKKPFWIISNNNNILNNGSIINLKYKNAQKYIDYGLSVAQPLNTSKETLVNTAFILCGINSFLSCH